MGVAYNDNSTSVKFVYSYTNNKLYAKTANGSSNTLEEITGITLTSINHYRIEFDPGNSAKFYVNGNLVSTITTTLPSNSNTIYIGSGTNGSTDFINKMSQPSISVEK